MIPNLFGTRNRFNGRQFSTGVGGWFEDVSSTLHLLYTLFLLLLTQLHLISSGIRFQRLGTSVLKGSLCSLFFTINKLNILDWVKKYIFLILNRNILRLILNFCDKRKMSFNNQLKLGLTMVISDIFDGIISRKYMTSDYSKLNFRIIDTLVDKTGITLSLISLLKLKVHEHNTN